ncbi:tetratricopeptide repeat protein [Bradyrhizobium sp. 62B]|uniref:tetratricopeptide repeat protein n=1 Tax=Bradyrhizobium sp. 62B TaxID=2898442 RepID=UPI0025581A2E|nr:tetratricopeptide repeat protein [Bradyrhizobium sp. 62B]
MAHAVHAGATQQPGERGIGHIGQGASLGRRLRPAMTSFYAPRHLEHIAGLEKRFGPVSDEVATALRSLVRVICDYEDPVDAAPFLERGITIAESLHGPRSVLPDLDKWIGHASRADFEHIEPFQLRRLAIKTEIFGEDSEAVAEECEALGRGYASSGGYAKARVLLERSISIKEKLHGAHSAEVAAAVDLLAETSTHVKKWTDAKADLERSLSLKQKVFGKRSEEVARCLLASAIVHANASTRQRPGSSRRSIEEAVAAFKLGLGMLEKRFGPDSVEVQVALEEMIRTYVDCRQFRTAEPLLKRLLSISELAYGEDAAALLWILAELAVGYADAGSEATEPMLERGFELLQNFLGARKPIFRNAIMDYAGNKSVLYGEGVLERLVQASEMFRRNLSKRWGA